MKTATLLRNKTDLFHKEAKEAQAVDTEEKKKKKKSRTENLLQFFEKNAALAAAFGENSVVVMEVRHENGDYKDTIYSNTHFNMSDLDGSAMDVWSELHAYGYAVHMELTYDTVSPEYNHHYFIMRASW